MLRVLVGGGFATGAGGAASIKHRNSSATGTRRGLGSGRTSSRLDDTAVQQTRAQSRHNDPTGAAEVEARWRRRWSRPRGRVADRWCSLVLLLTTLQQQPTPGAPPPATRGSSAASADALGPVVDALADIQAACFTLHAATGCNKPRGTIF